MPSNMVKFPNRAYFTGQNYVGTPQPDLRSYLESFGLVDTPYQHIEDIRLLKRSVSCGVYIGQEFNLTTNLTADLDGSFSYTGVPKIATTQFNIKDLTHWTETTSSLTAAIDGLSGTTQYSPTSGITYSFSGSKSLSGFAAAISLKLNESAAGAVNGQLSIQFAVDTNPVQYSVTGQQSTARVPQQCTASATSPDPVTMSDGGSVSDPIADLTEGGPLPFAFERHYDSMLNSNGLSGAMGDNWIHTFETRVITTPAGPLVVLSQGGMIQFAQGTSGFTPLNAQPLAYQLQAATGGGFQFLNASDGYLYSFNSSGALTGIRDRKGNALTVTPGPSGPASISDGLGRTFTLAYNTGGQLISVTDQGSRSVKFTYTGTSLSGVTDSNGNTTRYTYTTINGLPGMLATVKRPSGNVTLTQTWSSAGRVSQQSNATSNSTTFTYGPNGGDGSVTDPAGGVTKYSHSDLLHASSTTDPVGDVSTTAYDAAGHPLTITDPMGNKNTITYDSASGLPATRTDPYGNVTKATYITQTQAGFQFYLLSKISFPDGSTAGYQYDSNGNLTSEVDQAGNTTQYSYNTQGWLTKVTNAATGATTFSYNPDGTVASATDPSGNVTQYAWDVFKRLVKTTYADGSTRSVTYDNRDHVLTSGAGTGTPANTYDLNGNRTAGGGATATYDADDRVSSQTRNGGTSTTAYDAAGRPQTLTNAAGEKTTIAYNAAGEQTSVLDASGKGITNTWNPDGYLQSQADALSNKTSFTRNAFGRILTATTPLGEKATLTYDAMLRPTGGTTTTGSTTKNVYDPRGLLIEQDLPGGVGATYSYGPLRGISAATDPNGNKWTFTSDKAGLNTAVTDPLGRSTSLTYDSRNRVNGFSNSLGSAVYTRDSFGHVTEEKFSDGADFVYQYQGRNLVSGSGFAFTYDSYNNLTASNGIANTFDPLRRLLTVTYAAGKTVTYKYNNLGELTQVQDWTGGVTTLTYDAAHRLTQIQRPNGTVTAMTRDANGNLATKTETTKTGTYSFTITRDAEWKIGAVSRTLPQLPLAAASTATYAYDAGHQVSGNTYDGAGRLNGDALRTYKWNLASQLVSYNGVDGQAQFTYDGLGMRLTRATSSGTESYVWNYAYRVPVLQIVRSGSADQTYYIYLPGGNLIESIDANSSARHFYHFDEAGNTSFLTDDSGAVSDTYGISPYGEVVTHTGSTNNPFTFQGGWGAMQEGGTTLYYFRARYYDSASARFLSHDPAWSLSPRTINPYGYALGNPILFRDPTGRDSEPQAGGGQPGASSTPSAYTGNGLHANDWAIFIALAWGRYTEFGETVGPGAAPGAAPGPPPPVVIQADEAPSNLPPEDVQPVVGDLGGFVDEIL